MTHFMNSMMSRNQMANWNHFTEDHDERVVSYFECLVECNESDSMCKRICREVIAPPS